MTRTTEEFNVIGATGALLAGRLDLPKGPPIAAVLYAHCFTCSKDYHASTRICRGLAERGFAVLRFDFTGLGGSAGAFDATTFSTNVADILAAAAAMTAAGLPPRLLMGHSLGGTAMLRAAAALPGAGAIVTMNSPFSPAHLERFASARRQELEREGRIAIDVGDRMMPLTADYLADIANHDMQDCIADLARPLLVLHDPADKVVGAEQAERIFTTARHPKSFLALERSGHLVADLRSTAYVAEVTAAWAKRALRLDGEVAVEAPPAAQKPGPVTVHENGGGIYRQWVTTPSIGFQVDEPLSVSGGQGTGPTPFELLQAALGACTAITLRMYAERKRLPLGPLRVRVEHGKAESGQGEVFSRRIMVKSAGAVPLQRDQLDRIVEIAHKCPVHRVLSGRAEIITELSVEDEAPSNLA
jgi:uncharacterized OsmC-like protein/pimeloyl-ACP methyl ester carboxylesterase